MLVIHAVNISAVNLNLFVAFDALLAERNVTRAAARLGLTQSALSNALRQLRQLFDDPLFVRGARGVTPTPRALALEAPIRRGLAALGAALSPPTFDAERVERRFTIAASDHVALVLLPSLLGTIRRKAPGLSIDVVPWGLHYVTPLLEQGRADLMIGFHGKVPPQHAQRELFVEEFTCIARRGHPTIRSAKLTLKAWLAAPHVVVTEKPDSASTVDRALGAKGLRRIVGVRVPHFSVVPRIVAETDFVAALGARIAAAYAKPLGLRTFAPPLALPPGRIGMVWHERWDADPGHTWLRETIAEVSRRM